MFPESVTPVLLQAAILVSENKLAEPKKCLASLLEYLLTSQRCSLWSLSSGCRVSVKDLKSPAHACYCGHHCCPEERVGDADGAEGIFDNAIRWWSNALTEDKLIVLMGEEVSFKLKHGRQKEALELFEELVKNKNNVDALVGMVTTAAHVNVDKAEAYEKKLKSLLKGINVDDT